MAQTPEEMAQAMIDNMKEKTGKTLEQWLKISRASGLEKHGQILKFLKIEHGMTHGFASLVAHKTLAAGNEPASGEDLVDQQYSGPKEGLRAIYDAVIGKVTGFGDDVEISPKKSYVSLRRSKQFGLIQPSTKTRLDLGIKLPGTPPSGRLEASGSFNAMVSHRVRLTNADEVDGEVTGWLRSAYDQA